MILTLDLGTTYFKAGQFDRDGTLQGLYRTAPPIRHPQPGRWELDAAAFRDTIRATIRELGGRSPRGVSDIEAVTFATQTNTFVLLDAADQPLTPIILWPDDRAVDLADDVQHLSRTPGLRGRTGIPGLSTQFMAAKLRWLQRKEGGVWDRTKRLCLLSDYLTLWITGHHVTEAGAAGLTGAVDIHDLRWWPEVCERLELPVSWLPTVVRAGTDLGPVRAEVADELGLPRTCRFVVGCLDQFAGAIGAGNIHDGNVSETTGTVLATVRCANRFTDAAASGVFQGPAFDPGVFYEFVFGDTSANLLEWYRNQLPGPPSFQDLDEMAAESPPGAEGLRLRPGAVPGGVDDVFVGLTLHHTPAHCARAIMEGVAFALAEQVDQLCGSARPVEIRSCGGAARSGVWLQIKADVLNMPFVATLCPEPTSLGAAALAAKALGWADLSEIARKWIRTRSPRTPAPASI